MKYRWRKLAVLVVAAVLVASTATLAQETRGRITGRVTDSTKGVIPGATVTVTDATRGTTSTATTNDQGLFLINYLLPGTYKVVVELQGFKKQVQEGVQVEVNQTRDLAVVLEVGAMEESVSVVAEAVTINTTDASLGLNISQKMLESLPLIHGDPYKIMGLATGLSLTGDPKLDRPFEPTHIIGFAFDGTRGNRSDLLIDGAPSTATANANEVIATYVPQSDLVSEFRVQTATFDAQFGNTEGGVTSMSIKSGTNKFHGTGYYFAEPVSLGANDVFGNARGQAKIDSSSNRPGFTIGGPVSIPKLYSGQDKTWFQFGYERIADMRARFDIAGTSWVPTEALRKGDFSAYSSQITIYDPLTRTGTGTFIGKAFPGNVIPDNRISPVAKAFLTYYCLPKNPGTDPATGPAGNISDATLAERTKYYDTLTGKVDHRLSNSNRMFARASWYERNSLYNDYLGTEASGVLFQFISKQFVVDDVHVFNPTTTLNVRYGYNRFDRNQDQNKPDSVGFDQTNLGFPAQYNTMIPEILRRFPALGFTGGQMVTPFTGGDFRPVISHTVTAVLNKTMGAHSMKTGMEVRQYGESSRSTNNNQSGTYTFTNAYTRQSSASGTDYQGLQEYAAFLLGMPSTMSITRSPTYDEYSRTLGFFVQDDWRVNSRLTLNLGLRYEVENALVERDNKSVSNFDYAYTQPIEAQAQARYAALNDPALKALVPQLSVKGGLMFVGVDTPRLYTTPKNTFLPRVGTAYQINPKTVLRAGIGLFAGFLGERRGDVIQTGYSQTTTVGLTANAFNAPIPQYWDSAFITTPPIEPVGNALGRQTSVGNAISFFNPDPKVSKQLRGQIGIQRELAGRIAVEVAYVGNYGYDIEITRNINALPIQYLNADNSRSAAMNANNTFLTTAVANPFAGLLPGTGFNNATIARSQLLLPYPQFGAINTTNNDGKSWYNAIQIGMQKRFSKGNSVGLSYTWSKWMQATEYLNPSDPTPTKMISDLDVPSRLTVNGIYVLPFGKGQKFLAEANGIVDALVGGWQIQGVYTYQSGFPLVFGTDAFYTGTDPVNGSDIKLASTSTSKWFNTAPFVSILNNTGTNATPVNHLRTLPLRFSDVRSDTINNVDLSLIKDVRFDGGVRLQFRLEFINAMNHAYLAASARAAPITNPQQAAFGQVTNANQANWPRRAQVGVKILF
jgi:hypothetical protein